jgi:hypothetical protein
MERTGQHGPALETEATDSSLCVTLPPLGTECRQRVDRIGVEAATFDESIGQPLEVFTGPRLRNQMRGDNAQPIQLIP